MNVEVFGDRIREVLIESLDSENLNDLHAKKNRDIDMHYISTIRVDKNTTRNFDALQIKKRNIFWKQKNISLQKKQDSTMQQVEVYISKKIKRIKNIWYISLWIWILIFSIAYGIFAKIIVENRVNSGYEKLMQVKEGNIGFTEIHENINNARFDFILSDILFAPFSLIPSEKINSVDYAIAGWKNISWWLDQVLSLYEKIYAYTYQKEISQIYFTQLFLNIYNDVYDVRKSFLKAADEYSKISWLPTQWLEEQRLQALEVLEVWNNYLDIFLDEFQNFVNILGHEERRRYLIVFQNSDEIRPTGGFMGSMALVEMFKWQIKLFQKKDVYAIEWDLKSANYERLPAPKWLSELTDTFGLRDANYFVNIEDSSKTIKFFTDNANIDIDGVIYINQNILIKLLELTGPIYFDDMNQEVNSENFSYVMSLLVESKISKQWTLWTPKQVLFDFIELFTAKLIEDGKYFEYLQVLIHEAKSRDIMMWSFYPEENDFLTKLWINGEIDYNKTLDFIYPVYTSLSWNKSDRYISREYSTSVTQDSESCDFFVTQQIKSSHNMGTNEKRTITDLIEKYDLTWDDLLQIQWNARNRQYVRVLLPAGAEITPKDAMEIVDYGSRKWIEFFLTTPVQQAEFFDFSYTLKNPECKQYNTMYYKQPGIQSYDVNIMIENQNYNFERKQEDFYFEMR